MKRLAPSLPLRPGCSLEEQAAWAREAVPEARARTLELVSDLDDADLRGSPSPITNPFLWEIGHVAWFQERWVLRHHHGEPAMFPDVDRLYDSSAIEHDIRWDLPLHNRKDAVDYLECIRDRVLEKLSRSTWTQEEIYLILLSVFHEDMHTEAFTYMRHTLEYPPPVFIPGTPERMARDEGAGTGDVEVPGGKFLLGSNPDEGFVFDNEKWAHEVEVRPFRIARTCVSQEEFLEFVEAGGYERDEFWDEPGQAWRREVSARHPVYWRREARGEWSRRWFQEWLPLEAHLPVMNVSWHEARAYCRFRGRRLPTEIEWEVAAAAQIDPRGTTLLPGRQRCPWGEEAPEDDRANLDWSRGGGIDVNALSSGDSPCGCRQMLGNVWEWTESAFLPYPGFSVDAYEDYSRPWFETHKVLRGGCWATRSRLIKNAYRNFYLPERRDVWAGFRTCAL